MFSPGLKSGIVEVPNLGSLILWIPLTKESRKLKKRSFSAGLFFVRRAPPMQQSKRNSSMAARSAGICRWFRLI